MNIVHLQANKYIHEQQKEVQMQQNKDDKELEQKQDKDRVNVNTYEFRILLTWIPKGVLKNQLKEEILKLNVPPVDVVRIGKFKTTKNLFAFFSWRKSDPRLTLAAFGDFKLPGLNINSYIQLCDPKVCLPPEDSLIIPSFSKSCKKCIRGNNAARYGDASGAEKIQLLSGIEFQSNDQEIEPIKMAEQIIIYKTVTLTAVKTSMNKDLNDIVKEVEATKEDLTIKTNLCTILKQVFIKKYPEVDIEMYGSLVR